LLLSVKSNTIPEKERSTFCIKITYIKEGVYRVLVGKPEGRRPLGRPRRRWADNINDGSPGSWMWVCGLDSAGPG